VDGGGGGGGGVITGVVRVCDAKNRWPRFALAVGQSGSRGSLFGLPS
jgi:hypothetical protein